MNFQRMWSWFLLHGEAAYNYNTGILNPRNGYFVPHPDTIRQYPAPNTYEELSACVRSYLAECGGCLANSYLRYLVITKSSDGKWMDVVCCEHVSIRNEAIKAAKQIGAGMIYDNVNACEVHFNSKLQNS